MSKSNNVFTLGCRLNFWESNQINNLLSSDQEKGTVVFNTCSVTNEAVKRSQKLIRAFSKKSPETKIIVTGCGVESDKKLFEEMIEVSEVVKNSDKLDSKTWKKISPSNFQELKINDCSNKENPSNSSVRKFVKIQNGCNHSCTFCIIPFCRGKSISRDAEEINNEINFNLKQNIKEIILTGVDITSWGEDFKGHFYLSDLIEKILSAHPKLERLRLSSIDVAEIDEKLIKLIGSENRLMPHLHFSLQAFDDMILKRMKRRHTTQHVRKLFKAIKKVNSELTFGADFITGFPTETSTMFDNTLKSIEELELSHLHVFPYSEKKGTAAAKMPQVPIHIRRERAKILRAKGLQVFEKKLNSQINKKHRILIEDESGIGRTKNNFKVQTINTHKGQIVDMIPKRISNSMLF